MSFITLTYHFLAQQSISDNKNKDKIIFDKYFVTDYFVSFLFDMNKFFLHKKNNL